MSSIDLGLTAVKFGWVRLAGILRLDLAHVQAARDVVGDERSLMVDPPESCVGNALIRQNNVPELLATVLNIDWLEEPLSQDDRAGYGCTVSGVAGSNVRIGRRGCDSLAF